MISVRLSLRNWRTAAAAVAMRLEKDDRLFPILEAITDQVAAAEIRNHGFSLDHAETTGLVRERLGTGRLTLEFFDAWLDRHETEMAATIVENLIDQVPETGIAIQLFKSNLRKTVTDLRSGPSGNQPPHLHDWTAAYEEGDSWWECPCGAESNDREPPSR